MGSTDLFGHLLLLSELVKLDECVLKLLNARFLAELRLRLRHNVCLGLIHLGEGLRKELGALLLLLPLPFQLESLLVLGRPQLLTESRRHVQ